MNQSSENTEGFFPVQARQNGEDLAEQEPVQARESKDTFSANTAPVIIITPA